MDVNRVSVTLMNALGQQVMVVTEQTTNKLKETLDVSSLESGVYFVTIVSGNQQLVRKVTITD